MSRIPLIGRAAAAGPVREAFERKILERGNIPNMYRAFAHRPWLLSTMDAHFAAVVGLFNYFNRFNEALGMEPTKPGEGVDS